MGVERQQELYEEAMRLFYAHKFDRADALFQKVLAGPDRTLAHHAQVHSKICANRLKQPEIQLRTAEDHYNYAVTLLNERKLEEATRHLESAVRMSPHSEHLHYALAAAAVARGDLDGACRRLKTAIDLEPQNRFRARSDPDFHASLDYPPMASLLQFDRGSAPGRERPGGE
jgi:tetratricopeptide (TPR) repeat protein